MLTISIGDKFGLLTVIKQVPKPDNVKTKGKYYLCKCDCGNEKIVYGHNLKTGNTKSCGCLSKKTASINNSIDIPIGTKFNKLTVLHRAEIKKGGNAYWTCKCDCGNIIDVRGDYLRNGHT